MQEMEEKHCIRLVWIWSTQVPGTGPAGDWDMACGIRTACPVDFVLQRSQVWWPHICGLSSWEVEVETVPKVWSQSLYYSARSCLQTNKMWTSLFVLMVKRKKRNIWAFEDSFKIKSGGHHCQRTSYFFLCFLSDLEITDLCPHAVIP